jgi:hypothetical protein
MPQRSEQKETRFSSRSLLQPQIQKEQHKTNDHDAKECKVILAQCRKMASSYDSKNSFKDGKRQKTEYNKSKTEQMFSFMVNAFKAASNKKESENKSNEKSAKQMKTMHLMMMSLISLIYHQSR